MKKKIRILAFALALTAPSVLFSANVIQNPLRDNVDSIGGFIELLIPQLVTLAGVVAVIFLLYSGFLFVKAQGNEDEIATAKTNFYHVVIGTGILLGASVIAKIIQATVATITK